MQAAISVSEISFNITCKCLAWILLLPWNPRIVKEGT